MTGRLTGQGVEVCREQALRLLDRRPHSVAELRDKLRVRDFPVAVIGEVLADLQRVGLLDDAAFAKAYVEYRRSGGTPMGRTRIVAELRRRGIAAEMAEATVDGEASAGAEPVAETDRAWEAGRRKWASLSKRHPVHSCRERVFRFLVGRGFAPGICRDVIDRLADGCEDDGASSQ